MKVRHFLRRHAWSVRVVAAAVVLSMFVSAEVYLYAYRNDLDTQVANAESSADIAASKALEAKRERAEAQKAAGEAAKQQATASTDSPHRNPANLDVVVNKKNPLIPLGYTPTVAGVSCAGHGTITVQVQVRDDLTALCNAAAAAGVPLSASSAYRSYSYQVTVYNRWVAQSGQAQADTFSARPGYSEHQTGFAIDFSVPGGATLNNFTGTAQQQWLAAHGAEYGFIQRYTEANSAETGYVAESWHYRYIGRVNAAAYVNSRTSSLESFWGVSGGDY